MMTMILVSGWNDGFNKVGFTQLLKSELGMTLYPAKQITNRIMHGEQVEIDVPEVNVNALLIAMTNLGARCEAVVAQTL